MSRDPCERIYDVVCSIPRGTVATYGQVAALAGLERRARMVGQALRALDEGHDPGGRDVPWHRVINAQGRLSLAGTMAGEVQRQLLAAEGIPVDEGGRVDLRRYRWQV